MYARKLLSATGLLRPVRRRGFCPACKGWAEGDDASEPRREIARPVFAAGLVLVFAALAWSVVIFHSKSMGDMAMDLGYPGSFALGWLVMMTAMMLPTVLPLVAGFVHQSERRVGWKIATGLLIATYLAVWLAFGLAAYGLYSALGMPWPSQRLIGGTALVLAGIYALTPLKRSSDARCRELCALHGALPFNLQRSAMLVGVRYGVRCVASSAALMLAMVLTAMSSLGWMAFLSAIVLRYKQAPLHGSWERSALSAAVALAGLLYALG